ncbi:MAG: PQQ-binding-like beta-propeller repeat protein [Planctomycetales bacterium]|nr:PQQ-binding-like beta-propeller repeat protein [Planctomycetales bacterium]
MKRSLVLLVLLTTANATIAQDNWPRFRGPGGNGVVADDVRLPETWDKTENIAWVADVPGLGCSSPIVWGNRVFVTAVISEEENTLPSKGLYLGQGVRDPAKGVHHWMVYCFDRDSGKELWKHEPHTGEPAIPRHPKSSYAAETPTTDGERLYVLFGDVGLYAYNLDGEQIWQKEIEAKKTFFDYGAAGSPVVHDGQVFVIYDNLEDSWIAAFDSATGNEKWRTSRDEKRSWATPLVWQNEMRTEIVVTGLKKNRSYDLNGNLLWEFDGNMSNLVIPSPFAAHGMCYLSAGYVGDKNRHTFAIKPGGSGDIATKEEFAENDFIEWFQPQASAYNTTQIVYGDYLYTIYDQGFITCHDAKTGDEVYGKQRFSPRGSFTSSPWAYNGKVFCISEDGLTYVVKHGPEYELLGTNDLDEFCMATPAVSDGRLYVRTQSKLYCITNGQ